MKLDGKVSKIERIVGQFRRGEVADEKRVFHLSIRLKDESLQSAYTYGYGQMHFIMHGKAMTDFIDLGAAADVYIVPQGQVGDVPNQEFEDLRAQLYALEGQVTSLTNGNETLKTRAVEMQQENQALRERLRVAMEEVMRLELHQGIEPPAPAALEDQR
jgi:hypothetical protein